MLATSIKVRARQAVASLGHSSGLPDTYKAYKSHYNGTIRALYIGLAVYTLQGCRLYSPVHSLGILET